ARDRVFRLALAEHRREVLLVRFEGAGADGLDGKRSRGRVVAIGTHRQTQSFAQRSLRLWPQVGVGAAVLGARPVVDDQLALAMELVGSPIGCPIATVTPDRALLHPAQRLPHGLAASNGPLGCDHLTVASDDSLWDGRHFLVDAATDPA